MTQLIYQPFGAAGTVTGSRHLFRFGSRRVLLDCGLFQGHRAESRERNKHLPVLEGLEAVVLSHAHIDHSGALPALVKDGWKGKIFATPATRDLCEAMLADSGGIQESDARYLNKHRSEDDPVIEPLYTRDDAERTMRQFVSKPYDETFEVMDGVRATFRDAGHIIGSAGILLEGAGVRVYFTGDLGRRSYPILKDPAPLPESDVVLSECTYGDRDHKEQGDIDETIGKVLERAARVRGKVLVPAFSVGRTQNLVYRIARGWLDDRFPKMPIFVDSPLALKATQTYVAHENVYDEETKGYIGDGGEPFHPVGVRYVQSSTESKKLNDAEGPFIVIAGSGMCEGGRILHHLLHGIEEPRNTVLFVGYAAPNTLARRIMDGQSPVRIFRQRREVNAQVERVNGMSAHADRGDLLRFLEPARAWGSRIFLVHGDDDAAREFRSRLKGAGHEDVEIAECYAEYPLQRAHAPAGG